MTERKLGKDKQLEKELCWEYPNITEKAPEQQGRAREFTKGYMEFLGTCKTKREYTNYAEKPLLEADYERFGSKKKYKVGDKVFSTNRGKAVVIMVFDKKLITGGVRVNGAHVGFSRIDLRPNPPYKSDDIALFETHYYGGIKKYQWDTVPLTMRSVIMRKDGATVEITIGEDPSDPVLYIANLLIHLAKQQVQRTLSGGLRAEELNIVLGTTPYPNNSVKEPFRLEVPRYLGERYSIIECDFTRTEIESIPTDKPRSIGFDRLLVGDCGQDDRVYTHMALRAQLSTVNPGYTTVITLTDKEEIGSCGTTGLRPNFLYDYVCYLTQMEGVDTKDIFAKSTCLSADVNDVYDPTFADALEAKNSDCLNCGVVLTKYTGSDGKSGASGASVESMVKVIDIMDKDDVYWRTGELGKLDLGGGGTIAGNVARLNVGIVNLGVAVLSMHSPFGVTSKLGNYNMYLAFKAFYPEAQTPL